MVFNQYASSDTGAFICNCEYGSLHVNPEFGICELLNREGKLAGPGEEAEIVATSFCNREQVFVRYRIGDTVITGSSDECPCGRKMPIVADLTGRVDDTLYISDRGYIGRFDPIFKGLAGIYEAQIVQELLSRLDVKLVPAPGYDETMEAALVANLRAKVGETVEIAVEKVAQIPRGPNGKFRSVKTLCRDRYPSM
jgi:phenylacetate-CoA ligase